MTSFIIAGFLGPPEIIIIVIVVIILFGGRKIPELMKGIGQGMKEFKKATRDDSSDDNEEKDKGKIESKG